MAKKKVCISFDYENDRLYRYLLQAWDKNSDFEFSFNDLTPSEVKSNDISRIKAGLTLKINAATYLLVLVGKYANKKDRNAREIGNINWQNWEIAKAKELKKRLVGVKIEKANESPQELLGSGAEWAMSFTQDAIIGALNRAAGGK